MREHLSSPRFNGSATGALHARRASAEYIDGSIHVRIGAVSAIYAFKDRLALAASGINGPAGRACLRGKGGIDEVQHTAPLGELVIEHGGKRCPALIEDRTIEATLTASRSRHVGGGEFFQCHRAEPPCNVGRSLVQPMTPSAGHFSRSPRQDRPGFSSPLGSCFPRRQPTLCEHLGPLLLSKGCRQGAHFSVRHAEVGSNTAINSDRLRQAKRRNVGNDALYGGEPTSRFAHNGNGIYLTAKAACNSGFNRKPLGQLQSTPLPIIWRERAAMRLHSKRDLAGLASKSRETTAPVKSSERFIEVFQRVFENAPRDFRKPRYFPASLGNFEALGHPGYVAAALASEMSPPITALLKGGVVNKAAAARPAFQCRDFISRGVNPEAVGSLRHVNIIATFVRLSKQRITSMALRTHLQKEASK